MKLSKKVIMIILIAIVAALVIGSCTYFGIQLAKKKRMESLYANYDACVEELNIFIGFLEQRYPKDKPQPIYLRVAGGKMLLDPQNGYVNLPDEVSRLLTELDQKCFVSKDAPMFAITFHGSRIQFNSENGAYALVYSPEGKPDYLREEYEGFPIYVEHIEGPWYHVSRIG